MRGVPNKRKPGRPKHVRYKRLRSRMQALGLSADDLGAVCRISGAGISRRLSGQTPWQLWEAYAVLGLLGVPDNEIYLYFPASGEDVESVSERKLRSYLNETNQSLIANSTLDALVALVESANASRSPGA